MLTTGHRIAVMITLTTVLVAGLAMVLQYELTRQELLRQQKALVQADLDGYAALYDQRRIISVRQAITFRQASGSDAALAALWDRDGAALAGNIQTWPPFGMAVPPEGSTGPVSQIMSNSVPYLAAARMLPGGFPVVVARPMADMHTTLRQFRRTAALSLLAVLGLGTCLGVWVSRRILTRVNRLNRLAGQVRDSGDLSLRIQSPPTPDEFGALQENIHRMLDRIEGLHHATRTLSETIAHEMRTPLSRIQARIQNIPSTPQELEQINAEMRNTIRIFDAILEIARAEAAGKELTALAPLDLSELIASAVELYAPSLDAKGLVFSVEIEPELQILGDRNLIAQLISNLIENALKFVPSGDSVKFSLTRDLDRPVLTVSDTGPGIPVGFEDRIFERFSRAGDQASGSGLGLTLVRAIALRHGAKLSVPRSNRGFVIQITWPKLPTNNANHGTWPK